jgi:hypothetical protein
MHQAVNFSGDALVVEVVLPNSNCFREARVVLSPRFWPASRWVQKRESAKACQPELRLLLLGEPFFGGFSGGFGKSSCLIGVEQRLELLLHLTHHLILRFVPNKRLFAEAITDVILAGSRLQSGDSTLTRIIECNRDFSTVIRLTTQVDHFRVADYPEVMASLSMKEHPNAGASQPVDSDALG